MLTLLQGGFHVDLHSELLSRISPLVARGRRVYLVVPEMETLQAEEEAARELPPDAPRCFEVTNFTRLANTVFREVGGLCEDPYDKTARALLMWRALSEAMPLFSENTKNDITVGTVERALRAVSEMQQLCVDREALEAARTHEEVEADARLSGKLSDLMLTMEFYGRLMREDGKITSELSRMEGRLAAHASLLSDAVFFLEGFTSFTEPQLRILALLLARAEVTVALRLPKHLSGAFEYTETRATAERLLRLAASIGCEAQRRTFDTNRLIKNEALVEISKILWSHNAEIDNDCLQNLGDSLRIFSARTPYEEASFIVNDIAGRVRREGLRYSDFAIVARDVTAYAAVLSDACREGGIPAFISRERAITSFEGIKLIDLAYRAVFSGFARADVIAYAKCGLIGLSRHEVDVFELYVERWGIRGAAFCDEDAFLMNPDGYTARMSESAERTLLTVQKARACIMEPLVRLKESSRRQTVKEHARALVELLIFLNMPKRLGEQAEALRAVGENTAGEETDKLWHTIVGILDKVVSTVGDFTVDARAFNSLLTIAFSSVHVGRLPESQDEITLGSANSLRLYRKKHVYLVGVNWGEFPAAVSDGSYFTERERALLRDVGLTTEPSADVRCAKEQFFFTRAFLSASDSVTLITTQKNASFKSTPPSAVITGLERASGGRLRPVVLDQLPTHRRVETVRGAFDALAGGVDTDTERALLLSLCDVGEGELVKLSQMPLYNASLSLSPEVARSLYPKELALTQSRLESFIDCPLHHFLRYVLRLGEEREVRLDALSIGNMIHAILERFFLEVKRTGEEYAALCPEVIRERIERCADAYLRSIGFFGTATPSRRIHTAKRITEGAIAVVSGLVDELAGSKYVPAFFELKIERNNPDAPSPHTVQTEDGCTVYVYGTIDRVDTYVKDDTAFVRVIDYKTGKKPFSRADLDEGKNLQMFLYLSSILESTSFHAKLGVSSDGEVVGGGVIYVQTALDAKASPTPDFDPVGMLCAEQKRSGMVLWEEESIDAMHPDYLPISVNRDKTVSQSSKNRVYSREGWREIVEVVDESVRRVAHDMRSGEIGASPLKGKSAQICSHCPYHAVCRKTKG